MNNDIAAVMVRIEIDIPHESGRGWRKSGTFVDTQDEENLDDTWRRDLEGGARYMLEETWVKVAEPHYDAKCWHVRR